MTVHLAAGAAEACVGSCTTFIEEISRLSVADRYSNQEAANGAFLTALQIGTVYELFTGKDLQGLLNGFVDQVSAMSVLFAAAGGLIEAQDEAVAAALGKAVEAPPGMQSLGLMAELGSLGTMVGEAGLDGELPVLGYQRVGPEEVSGASLAQMVSGAQALDAFAFAKVDAEMGEVAAKLREATGTLNQGLTDVLSGPWQGEFAQGASSSLTSFVASADGLADSLQEVAHRAGVLSYGYGVTAQKITEQAEAVSAETRISGGGVAGGVSRELAARAATEQARAVVNTEYSPAVMDANLADLDFPTAYPVVSTTALGGPNGVDLARVWNLDGVVRPAAPATPDPTAIAAATGESAHGAGGASNGAGGPGAVAATASGAGVDATTEQALLESRAAAGDAAMMQQSAGPTTPAGTSAAGVNAATTAAAAPLMAGQASAQRPGAGATGPILGRGTRSGGRDRDRDRGFGSAAGLLGSGGAAGAGAGAAGAGAVGRMGGAGTLAGMGSGPGGAAAGPGAGSAPGGAFSSSSTPGGQAGGAAARPGLVPMGMMGAGAAGRGERREGHAPAGYLVNATNTSAIIGEPPRAAPAVLGRVPDEPDTATQREKPAGS